MLELYHRMTMAELQHWIAFLHWEAEQQLPPEERTQRPQTKEQAFAAMAQAFGLKPTELVKAPES